MPYWGETGKDERECWQIWVICKTCGKERWVRSFRGMPNNVMCRKCAAKRRICRQKGCEASNWKGGRFYDERGYVMVWLDKDDFFSPMIKKDRYAREHRLIMARHLGRNLQPWEIVHHKNGDVADNDIENLVLMTNGEHTRLHQGGNR